VRKALLLLALLSTAAHAFPEMVRHEYVNCAACHVSPSGGGILNSYGRQSSQAVLSTWGSEDEAKPFYGLFGQKDWLDTAAFGRAVQTAQTNSQVSQGYLWWMQAELEAAAHFGPDSKWTADLDLGVSPDVLNSILAPGDSPLSSPRHYLMYQPTDELSFRAGKFLLDYGVYFPEHTIATRQGIGFDEGMETYNLEAGYHGLHWSGSLTLDLGRPDKSSLEAERGVAATVARSYQEHLKFGWSAYAGAQSGSARELTGPYALLGLTDQLYLLAEVDLQLAQPAAGAATQGVFSYLRAGYELAQGLQLYLMQQNFVHSFSGTYQPTQADLRYGIVTNRLYGFGPGVYWFPRPHFFFQLEAQEQYSAELPSATTTGFLTFNVYL
jgi:hypothetical protein